MVTPHLPWKFHANWSGRFLVILLTLKQRKKSPENNTPSPVIPICIYYTCFCTHVLEEMSQLPVSGQHVILNDYRALLAEFFSETEH